jgi:hypothetical protein
LKTGFYGSIGRGRLGARRKKRAASFFSFFIKRVFLLIAGSFERAIGVKLRYLAYYISN